MSRITENVIVPTKVNVMTKPVYFIATSRICYPTGGDYYFTFYHNTGMTCLHMEWALDTENEMKGAGLTFDMTGTVHTLPCVRYEVIKDEREHPWDPKDPHYMRNMYDSYAMAMYKNYGKLDHHGNSGGPGAQYFEYIRMTIFSDTFDAPFIEGTIV